MTRDTFPADHPVEELRGKVRRRPTDVRRTLARRVLWLRTKLAQDTTPSPYDGAELAALVQALEAFNELHPPGPSTSNPTDPSPVNCEYRREMVEVRIARRVATETVLGAPGARCDACGHSRGAHLVDGGQCLVRGYGMPACECGACVVTPA